MYSTSLQAEEAFYNAFNEGDISKMMSIWSNDQLITCIHPGGIRLQGRQAVRDSWVAIFAAEQDVFLTADSAVCFENGNFSVHQVKEHISVAGEFHGTVLATNVYQKIAQHWKMISHHASAEPPKPSTRVELH